MFKKQSVEEWDPVWGQKRSGGIIHVHRCREFLGTDTREIGKHELSPERTGWPQGPGGREMHVHCQPQNWIPTTAWTSSLSVPQPLMCTRFQAVHSIFPLLYPTSPSWFPTGNNACPLESWARLLVVVSSFSCLSYLSPTPPHPPSLSVVSRPPPHIRCPDPSSPSPGSQPQLGHPPPQPPSHTPKGTGGGRLFDTRI